MVLCLNMKISIFCLKWKYSRVIFQNVQYDSNKENKLALAVITMCVLAKARRRRNATSVWVRSWLARRQHLGCNATRVPDLQTEDAVDCKLIFRIDKRTFVEHGSESYWNEWHDIPRMHRLYQLRMKPLVKIFVVVIINFSQLNALANMAWMTTVD